MAQPSLKDVAAKAGVSFQTAGKVLNGKGRVSTATRERILESAQSLDYVPNALARGLISRSTHAIGVIAADFSDSTVAQPIVGVEREARRLGLCVIIGSLDRAGSDAETYLRVLLERRVDGIIMIAPVSESNPRVGEILRRSVPAVSLHPIAGDGICLVTPDDTMTGLLPVRHLVALGHRRIGMVTGANERHVTAVRTAAYRQALEEAGLAFEAALVEEGHWEVEGGYRAAQRLLDRAADVTAIYAQNDTMAVGVLSALHDRGLRVPEDCAVVGCDNLPIASRTVPPLTTVDIHFYDLGAAAMGLLLELIASGGAQPGNRVLPVHMVYRRSSGASLSPTGGQGVKGSSTRSRPAGQA